MAHPKRLPGKFVWFEHVSNDAKRAQAFYAEVLGWKTVPFPIGGSSYAMIFAGETMIGGYATGERARWRGCVSVADVDTSAKAAAANGGTVVEPPSDAPGAGRIARIVDAQGAELTLFGKATDDPPDAPAPVGTFLWEELHTTDPASALAFYAKVVGFAHRTLDMGPAGAYHILSSEGVDRGGVTSHLPAGVRPHWLPYVHVDDVDATAARAKKLGGGVTVGPEDIPGVGRFAVLDDPTGAVLAVMKPLPRESA